MLYTPFYDPTKSYDENYENGPFGAFADGKVWKITQKPQFHFCGIPLDLPFGIPAGPLLNGKFVQAALDKGFSVATYKTVRSDVYPCHPWPNVLSVKVDGSLTIEKAQKPLVADDHYSDPISITNSFGVPSKSVETWQNDLKKLVEKQRVGQLVVGSFQGTIRNEGGEAFVQDCVETAALVKETGVKVMEMNLSCPNEGTSHLLCFDIERTEAIVKAVKAEIKETPLVLKIAYFQEQKQLEEFVNRVGSMVEAISAINTIPAKIVDGAGNQALPGNGRAVSGVCGDSIRWAGLEMVQRLNDLRKKRKLDFSIVGCGGVITANHCTEYREAGADVVMSATGAMWNPFLAQEVYKSLEI